LHEKQEVIRSALAEANSDEDLQETLAEELALLEKAISAPAEPLVRNFEKESEVEQVHEHKNVHGLNLGNQ